MCGIVCAFNIKGDNHLIRSKVLQMAQKVRHRGPDWSGVFSSKKAILAHERLAIVDPTSGKQPILSTDGQKIVAVNGEIYNGIMPHYNFLTDDQIADLLTYIRTSFGNNSSEITMDEVEEVRKQTTNSKP